MADKVIKFSLDTTLSEMLKTLDEDGCDEIEDMYRLNNLWHVEFNQFHEEQE